MKGIIIDGQNAGASGDMFLGALLDLAFLDEKNSQVADKKRAELLHDLASKIIKAADLINDAEINIEIIRKKQYALEGVQLKISLKEPHRHLKIPQANELLESSFKIINLSEEAKNFCKTAFQILFEAEAAAHGESLEKVHLHEAGSLDTFLDILGSAFLLDKLDLFHANIYVLPIALGSGTVTFSHGTLPVPAPAVAEIIKKYQLPVHMGSLKGELLTPTGAIIIATLGKLVKGRFVSSCPFITIEKIGVGFGSKEFEKTPNGLRLMVGNILTDEYLKEEIAIIETNVDDCTGETIGFLSQRLFDIGAKDVYLTPIFMKKGRPGIMISVLCLPEEVSLFAAEIMNQTSTIGVRISHSSKIMLSRKIEEFKIKISDKEFTVRCKIAYNKHGQIAHFKPEFDDLRLITEQTKLTMNDVASTVRALIAAELKKKK
ncbi:MAG: nickel pincer cofactor biosynthesis protein LarC [Candidatus Heimdallarchaeota archaeon]|nr:nickel pincer cofactor biosynthesis protein LarC [Candidatus Heimdallarchaeota archaeon]